MHLLKGCLGTGILAMPAAFYYAGLMFGLIATTIIGIICTYCVHVLVSVNNVHRYEPISSLIHTLKIHFLISKIVKF